MNRHPMISAGLFFLLLPVVLAAADPALGQLSGWRTEFIDLAVEIDPAHGSLQGDARMQLKNSGSGDQDVILELNHQLQVDAVTDGTGRTLPFKQNDGWITVPAQKRISTMDISVIRVRYHGTFFERIPELDMRNAWIGPEVSYAFYSSRWYPQIPGAFRRSRGKVSFLVPSAWVAASTGKLTATDELPGAKRFVFTVSAPVEYSFAAAPFVHHRQNIDGLEVGVFLLNGSREKIDFYMRNCVKIVGFFKEFYGFFPYDGYSMVELSPDLLGKAGAGSYEGMTFFPAPVLPERFFYTPVFAHEISHCWWGNCVRGAEGPVINEGLAQISMGLYLENVFGGKFFWNLLKDGAPKFLVMHSARLFFRALQLPKAKGKSIESLLLRGEDLELGIQATNKFTTLHMLSCCKGAFIYAMLREWIGPDAFRKGLRDALAGYAWNTLTLENLRTCFEKASGIDLKWFFEQWFMRKGAPEFAIDCWFAERSRNWLVQVQVTQLRDVYRVKAEIAFNKGAFRETRAIEINGRKTKFSFLLPFRPQNVLFDPDYKILRWSDQF
jgi:hypothetical protein